MNVEIDGDVSNVELGKELFYTRVGQLICPVQFAMRIIMENDPCRSSQPGTN